MNFQMGKRWIPKLNATIRKLTKQDPTIKIDIKRIDDTFFKILWIIRRTINTRVNHGIAHISEGKSVYIIDKAGDGIVLWEQTTQIDLY